MTGDNWFANGTVEAALERARAERKPVLVDFWHPTCLGCAKLAATTYPAEPVRQLLAEEFVCIKYKTTEPNDWYRQLNGRVAHIWHPHLVVMDHRTVEGRRFVGYQGVEALLAQLRLGAGVLEMYARRFDRAYRQFTLARSYPVAGDLTAESLYWLGVAAYRLEGRSGLERHWEELQRDHGGTSWAARADCLDVEIPEEGFDPDDPATVRLRDRQPSVLTVR